MDVVCVRDESYEFVDDFWKLCFGEIDLNFELKFVRFDLVDMDEDEKEMLLEVRVCLVNI